MLTISRSRCGETSTKINYSNTSTLSKEHESTITTDEKHEINMLKNKTITECRTRNIIKHEINTIIGRCTLMSKK